jgi:RHS repeat-associated protein
MLDHDTETDTDHAGFRQYSNKQGRFFSPDPYDGSYDMSNPQSMNRYVYAANSPLGNVDPSGADGESIWDEIGSSSSGCLINGVSGPCGMQYGPTFFGQPVSVYSGPTSYQSGGHTFTLVQGPDGLQWIGPAGQELSPGDAVEIGLPAIPVSTSFSDSFGISGGGTGGGGGSGDTSAQECEDKSNVVADSALYAGSRVHRLSQSNSQSCKAPSNPAPTPPKYGPQTPAQSQACHQFGVATAWTGAATVGTGTVGGILTLTGPGATVGVPLLFVSGAFGLTTATGTLIYAYVCQ